MKVAIWCGLILFAVFALSRTAYGRGPRGYEEVRVGAGETVWGIAQERYPGSDTRNKVDEILRINGLHDAVVGAGQPLKVPAE
jgi:LysM domain